jgi:hypothetical protein
MESDVDANDEKARRLLVLNAHILINGGELPAIRFMFELLQGKTLR